MIVTKITVTERQSGRAEEWHPDPLLNVLTGDSAEKWMRIFGILLRNGREDPSETGDLFGKNVVVSGEMTMQDQLFTVSVSTDSGEYTVFHGEKEIPAEKFFDAIRQRPEEERLSVYEEEKKKVYPELLKRYLNTPEYYPPQTFERLTECIGGTNTFRRILKAFIREHPEEQLIKGKPYRMGLRRDGAFFAEHPAFPGQYADLSANEREVFTFRCFLCINEFWREVENVRDMHFIESPLMIRDLFERLDVATDTETIGEQIRKLQRQTFILLPSCQEAEKLKNIAKIITIK